MRAQLFLILAILFEVVATTALAQSDGLTRLRPALIAAGGWGAALWLMSIALRTMPTGIVYALWAGVGIVLITLIGWVWNHQALDAPAIAGMGLIVAGVVVINLFSSTISH